MHTKLNSLVTLDLIDQLHEVAYILDDNANLLFVSKGFFNIIGMPNYTLRNGESLQDILNTSKHLGVIEQLCMETILQMDCPEQFTENKFVKLLSADNDQTRQTQTREFTKGNYRIKALSLTDKYTYYRYESIQDDTQMKQILQRVMHISKVGFYKYDFEKKLYFICDSLLGWFSRREQALMRAGGLSALLRVENQEILDQKIQETLARQNRTLEMIQRVNLHDKGALVVKLHYEITYNNEGSPLCALVIVHDISDYEFNKAALKKEKGIADRHAKFRANQIAHMSHEIRTPMGGIVGMVEVLLNENHSEETIEKLQIIAESSKIMMATLTETLDHCKLMAEGVLLKPTPVSPKELLESAQILWRDKASENEVNISYEISPDVPTFISIDQYRITQCLNNLLSNAVKFTTSGNINMMIKKFTDNMGHTKLAIIVKDSGIGMTEEEQRYLFKPFAQADESIQPRFGGTGLGMSITQKIIDEMKGQIVVKSKKNIGTTVGLLVPFRAASKKRNIIAETKICNIRDIKTIAQPMKTKLRRESILIVDDIESNRMILQYLLCDVFSNLVFAENGQEAIDVLEGKNIDIVLMDIHMPIINGTEAVKIIRSANSHNNDVPIIAVTADEKYYKRAACQVFGFDDVIAKPVDQVALFEIINKALAKPRVRVGNVKPLFASQQLP